MTTRTRWADRTFSADEYGRMAFGMYDEATDSYLMTISSDADEHERPRFRFHSQAAIEHAMRTWCDDGAMVGIGGDQGVPVASSLDWIS